MNKPQVYTWRFIEKADIPEVTNIVRQNILGSEAWAFPDGAGGVVCLDAKKQIATIVVIQGVEVNKDGSTQSVVQLTDIAVLPEYRGKGVGLVSLNIVEQFLANRPKGIVYGAYEASAAQFYAKAGYTVLDQGQALPILATESKLFNTNQNYPCYFFRYR